MDFYEKENINCVNESGPNFKCQQYLYANNSEDCATYFTNHSRFENSCESYYDGRLCWTSAPWNTTVIQLCSNAATTGQDISQSENITSFVAIFCSINSTWTKANYSRCEEPFWDYMPVIVHVCRYILYIGSTLSLVTLGISLFIFFYFKCLNCCRLKVHRNFCTSLIFNLLVLVISVVFYNFLQNHVILCKAMTSFYMYFCMASVNWMLVEGIFLHSRITTHVFESKAPFKLYYFIGWGMPSIFVLIWIFLMGYYYSNSSCWKNITESDISLIVSIPMLLALLVNAAFLINIIRILIQKYRVENNNDEFNSIRKAAKAAILLFPLLGFPYLIFSVRPDYNERIEIIFNVANIFLKSTQGTFFSFFYCFLNEDVQTALKNAYSRRTASRKLKCKKFSRTSNIS